MSVPDSIRPIPGHPGYMVSVAGDVYSCWQPAGRGKGWKIGKRWRRMKPVLGTFGYPQVPLRGARPYPLHVLVLLAFAGPRPAGMHCCHNDGNPANNHLSNLRYDTPAGNNADKLRHGTYLRGERHPNSKLTAAAVLLIPELRAQGLTWTAIARRFGVSRTAIGYAVHGRNWNHVTPGG